MALSRVVSEIKRVLVKSTIFHIYLHSTLSIWKAASEFSPRHFVPENENVGANRRWKSVQLMWGKQWKSDPGSMSQSDKHQHVTTSRTTSLFLITRYFVYMYAYFFWLAVWLSGNALASINVVALRQTRLVPGGMTVCGRVNHFGM